MFGESVTWAGSTVTVIFDDEDVEVQLGEGVAQIQNQPTMIGQTSDFSGIADGDAVVARGVTFKVKNWKRDGQGSDRDILGASVNGTRPHTDTFSDEVRARSGSVVVVQGV